ncbi:hypothetical protein AMTRI_Chr13g116010 [Amborella trichopoda]
MASTLASQLKAIKGLTFGDSAHQKRPLTQPSILFGPKEAADIDLETLLSIAVSGLESLAAMDKRFSPYRDTLFSQKSVGFDREVLNSTENNGINKSISMYLQLLSGQLQLSSAQKTVEYLIRRYKVHVYNMDDLVLCALPYHDTTVFVRIVQLLDLRNTKWGFLEGVKVSGAPPPRKVIVQQCTRDFGVLEAICNYAMPKKKVLYSRTVVGFSTAVIVETLGAVTVVDSELVQRIIPFVLSCLNANVDGSSDHKAGAVMIVGLLASRAMLAPNLTNTLIIYIARLVRQYADDSGGLSWLRVLVMVLVKLIQSQSVTSLPKKSLDILKEVRNLPTILLALSKEFNIEGFLSVYLTHLASFSSSDEICRHALIAMMETLLAKDSVPSIVSKVLEACTKLSREKARNNALESDASGSWAKQIFLAIDEHYPSELRRAIYKFLESPKMHSTHGSSVLESLCWMLDGDSNMTKEIAMSKIWFYLEHPKAEVRRATLSNFATAGILNNESINLKVSRNIGEALLRRLHDDDLSVVEVALSLDGLAKIVHPASLFEAFHDVLARCINILTATGSAGNISQACKVAVSCLDFAVYKFLEIHPDCLENVASLINPLLLVSPKTWRLNLKALEFVVDVPFPFFNSLRVSHDLKSIGQVKKLELNLVASLNSKTIGALAETFADKPKKKSIHELCRWCCSSGVSKAIFFLVMLRSFMIRKKEAASFLVLVRSCLPVLEREWVVWDSKGSIFLAEEFNLEKLETVFDQVRIYQLIESQFEAFVPNLLISIYGCILKYPPPATGPPGTLVCDVSGPWVYILDELFVLFSVSSCKHVFVEHLRLLVMRSRIAIVPFLSKYFTQGSSIPDAVQIQSLRSFAALCSALISSETSSSIHNPNHTQLLLEFPSVLVPLSSAVPAIRMEAITCIEGVYNLWLHVLNASQKNGDDTTIQDDSNWMPVYGELLELILQQKNLISSDADFIQSFLKTLLGPDGLNILMPQNLDQRFDRSSKEAILLFILKSGLKLPSYGKFIVLSMLQGVGHSVYHEHTETLLVELLNRRNLELSHIEVDILCLLLKNYTSLMSSSTTEDTVRGYFFEALRLDNVTSEHIFIVRPCATVLQNLSQALYDNLETRLQDQLFWNLVVLFRSDIGAIHNAARDALLRIHISGSTIGRHLQLILVQDLRQVNGPVNRVCKIQKPGTPIIDFDSFIHEGKLPSVIGALLDVILLKKDIENRGPLVEPLFCLIHKILKDGWLTGCLDEDEINHEASTGAVHFILQTSISILEDIGASVLRDVPERDEILEQYGVDMLIEYVYAAKDPMTRNHIFSLISTVVKSIPDRVLLNQIIDIFTTMGETSVIQDDSHSQKVFEQLISTVVPCWLTKMQKTDDLLKIFVGILPKLSDQRRLPLMTLLLRALGEKGSLASLLVLLFDSLVLRTLGSSNQENERSIESFQTLVLHLEWEYLFAVQLYEQYSCTIWLPSLVVLLQLLGEGLWSFQRVVEICVAMQFIAHKLEVGELAFVLKSGQDIDVVQGTLGELMEQVVSQLQMVDTQNKSLYVPTDMQKVLRESALHLLRTLAKCMVPSAYFRGIVLLLKRTDENVQHKALVLLCESLTDSYASGMKPRRSRKVNLPHSFLASMDERGWESFNEMCLQITKLIDEPLDDDSIPIKLAAASAFEALANKFSSNPSIFSSCLGSVAKKIGSNNLAVSSACLKATGAFVNALGPAAVPELSCIMEQALKRAHNVCCCFCEKYKVGIDKGLDGVLKHTESVLLAFLATLEALVDRLGGFLNPYLRDILELLVIHHEFSSALNQKIGLKAAAVQKLISEKISERLLIPPLLKIFSKSVEHGELSLSMLFEMLASKISKMDRSSVVTYHADIFKISLVALDLRRKHPVAIKNINVVERSVINAIVTLTMKLTETMFKPLFIRSLEWAESEVEENGLTTKRNLDRNIAFYSLIDKLAEKHRSLFVPYFKYLISGCMHALTDDEFLDSGVSMQKKKAKFMETNSNTRGLKPLLPSQWHLRALILSSLHKCFLHDKENLKFLDSDKFQTLCKAIVAQFLVDPPEGLDELAVPSVSKVDGLLVSCLGQMAVTAGTDLLWKPLNHEVLMQTRSEKMRARILGLRVVRYLLNNLKEEYLVLLPETIPFLGELLEDAELQVKTLAQEILKDMETLSGESLRQYL